MQEPTYTIGELAKLSGLPVKTIRHYSDVGVLPPASRTEAGYRLYGEVDRAKLALVRTLRALDLDLPTIRAVLERRATLQEVLELHARAVEAQVAALRRQQAVLQAATARGADAADVQRLHGLARLTAAERSQLVAGFLDQVFAEIEDVPAAAEFRSRMRAASLVDLPPEPTAEQLDAWLELLDLVSDEDFQRRLRDGSREFWAALGSSTELDRHTKTLNEIIVTAAETMAQGLEPASATGRDLADAAAASYAELTGRPDTRALRAEMAANWEAGGDPRAARYWELITVIKGWGPGPPPGSENPAAVYDPAVYAWLLEALRATYATEATDATNTGATKG